MCVCAFHLIIKWDKQPRDLWTRKRCGKRRGKTHTHFSGRSSGFSFMVDVVVVVVVVVYIFSSAIVLCASAHMYCVPFRCWIEKRFIYGVRSLKLYVTDITEASDFFLCRLQIGIPHWAKSSFFLCDSVRMKGNRFISSFYCWKSDKRFLKSTPLDDIERINKVQGHYKFVADF